MRIFTVVPIVTLVFGAACAPDTEPEPLTPLSDGVASAEEPNEQANEQAGDEDVDVSDAILVDVVEQDDGRGGTEQVYVYVYDLESGPAWAVDEILAADLRVDEPPAPPYAGNCWASRAGSSWRESPAGSGDWDYHALFNVDDATSYYVYASAALYAAARVSGDWPLVHGRDSGSDRVYVNLGSYGTVFYYSVSTRTWC